MRAAVTRVVVAGSAALLLVAALSACQPRFPAGGTLEVTSEGAGLRLSWPAASADADKQISTYRVDVDGVEVARLEAWATTCLLGGLAPGSSHQVSVTAYDSAGQWSGNANSNVSATVQGPTEGSAASGIVCDGPDPSVEQALDSAPAGDSQAVEAFLASEDGQPVEAGTTAVTAAGLDPSSSCATALSAVESAASIDFLSGIASSPDPVLSEAYWLLHSAALDIKDQCEQFGTPGAEALARIDQGLNLLAGREADLTATPASRSTTPVPLAGSSASGTSLQSGSTWKASESTPPEARPIWWALGDSYASGEGTSGTDEVFGAGMEGQDCQRASGQNGATAMSWAAVAYDQLFGVADGPFSLVACTGNITDDWQWQLDQARLRTGVARPDVISVEFGGNNLNFAGVLANCLDVARVDPGPTSALSNALLSMLLGLDHVPDSFTGCDRSAEELVDRVDQLTSPLSQRPSTGQTTIPELLDALVVNIRPGGHVIVAGYPMIFEDPSRWPLFNRFSKNCQGVRPSDARMIRHIQGVLNLELYEAVQEARAAHPTANIHWLDPSAAYENSEGRHGLCSSTGDQWLNGFTLLPRHQRSYHPNQFGHWATGELLADYLASTVGVENLKSDVDLRPIEATAGIQHSCALMDNGTVRCWGDGGMGQLGNGSFADRLTPVSVLGITNAVGISSSVYHTCAVIADGSVVCWGNNDQGQLGDGQTTDSATPKDVQGLNDAVEVSAGSQHSCALMSDTTVECWGRNDYGQLGDGTTTTWSTPTHVYDLTGAISVSVSSAHSCALMADGSIKCWGYNFFGQLGDGTTTSHLTPTSVTGITDAIDVQVGSGHTCAVLADGSVRCWGYNHRGQLGDGSLTNRTTPVNVLGVSGVTALAGSGDHSCALKADGLMSCWGYNDSGQLGTGSTYNSPTPQTVVGVDGAIAITATGTFASHTCALSADGLAQCWGYNQQGEVGDGTRIERHSPVPVVGL